MRTILATSVLALSFGHDSERTVALGLVFMIALVSVMRSPRRDPAPVMSEAPATPATTMREKRSMAVPSDVQHAGRRHTRR